MEVRYSGIRTLLFTFLLGVAIVSVSERLVAYWNDIPDHLPEVESGIPIIIRLCPESLPGNRVRGYREDGNIYFSKQKAMNCTPGGGGGSGARDLP